MLYRNRFIYFTSLLQQQSKFKKKTPLNLNLAARI
jgi:hypothetical protein